MNVHRRLARLAAAPVAALGLLVAVPAQASTHYFCYIHDAYQDRGFYMTPVMTTPVEELDETQTGFAFAEYASKAGYGNDAGSVKTGCISSSNAGYVREQHAQYPEWHPGMRQIDWPEPPVPSEPEEPFVPTDGLVIEEAEPPALTPEMLAAMALAEERRRAAALAKVMAENARRDAELDAKLQEDLRRAKRRGRMQ
jgi:hypothetical protein